MFLPKVPTHVNVQQCSTMSMFIRRSEKDLSSYYYCTQYICDICRKTGRKPPQEYNYVVFVSPKHFFLSRAFLVHFTKKQAARAYHLRIAVSPKNLGTIATFEKYQSTFPVLLFFFSASVLFLSLVLFPSSLREKKGKNTSRSKLFHLLVFIPLLHSRSTV